MSAATADFRERIAAWRDERTELLWRFAPLVPIACIAFLMTPSFSMRWPSTHEVASYPIRLEALYLNVAWDNPFPRWIPELAGHNGYPLFSFFNPGILYLGLPFRMLGLDAFLALKLATTALMIASALSLFALGKRSFGRGAGLVCACGYVFAPYVIANLYTRGDLAELGAMMIFPILVDRFDRFVRHADARNLLVIGLLYPVLVTTHAFSSGMFTAMFALMSLAFAYQERAEHGRLRRMPVAVAAFACGGLIAAVYWLPVLREIHTVQMAGEFQLKLDHLPRWYRVLLIPRHLEPFGGTLTIGVLTYFAGLGLALHLWRRRSGVLVPALALIAAGGLFMAGELAMPLYYRTEALARMQFPWRFLGVSTFVAAFLAGSVVPAAAHRLRTSRGAIAALAVLVTIALGVGIPFEAEPYWMPADVLDVDARNRREVVMVDNGEYYPYHVAEADRPPATPVDFTAMPSECVIGNPRVGRYDYRFVTRSTAMCRVVVHQLEWIGWHATLDGKPVRLDRDRNGRMLVEVPPGAHELRVQFRWTRVQRLAAMISGAGVALLLALVAVVATLRRRGWVA